MSGPTITHDAGHALNALVAEHVMGWPRLTPGQMEPLVGYFDYERYIGVRREDARGDYPIERFAPSTDIAAAWLVIERHGLGDWNWRLSQTDAGNWFAEVRLGYGTAYSKAFPVWADTAPLAICRAALAAARQTEPRP